MQDLWNYLKKQTKPVVLYGMGNGAEKILSVLGEYGIIASGVFASDGFARPKIFHGFKITDYKTARETFGDMIVLLSFGTAIPEVIENIKKIKGETELYAPDVPVSSGPLFNREFYLTHSNEIAAARELLADDISRRTFDGIINYKLSGNIDYLFACETAADEPYSSFLDIKSVDTFVDLGAYRGDTVLDFISRAGEGTKIIAAEPDAKTFEKLKNALKGVKNITLINAAVSSDDKTVYFSSRASRSSTALGGEEGGVAVRGFALDGLCLEGENIYIKADIEGAEADFIKGAKKTISEKRPKMRIAAYHKSEDIFRVPLEVKAINPSYKVYLRHTPCLPAWDTDCFFV